MIIAQYRCNLQKLPDPWNSHNYRPWKLMQKRLKRLSPMELGALQLKPNSKPQELGDRNQDSWGAAFFWLTRFFSGPTPQWRLCSNSHLFFDPFFFWCMDVFFWIPCSNSLPESHPSHPKWIHRISGICWSDSQDPGLRIASFIAAEGGEVGEISTTPQKRPQKPQKKTKEGEIPWLFIREI